MAGSDNRSAGTFTPARERRRPPFTTSVTTSGPVSRTHSSTAPSASRIRSPRRTSPPSPAYVVAAPDASPTPSPPRRTNVDPASRRTAYPTPEYARNEYRSIKPEYLVVVGICTHLGCSPTDKFQPGPQPSLPDDWAGGFFCPCHGSIFDLAGRVFSNMPAPDNLEVPPHAYLSDSKILIGTDAEQVGKDTA